MSHVILKSIKSNRKKVIHFVETTILYKQAIALAAQGTLDEAAALLEQVIDRQPDYIEAYHQLGIISYKMKNPAAAVDTFHRAIIQSPNNPDSYNNLGLLLMELNEFPDAERCFLQAIRINPNSPDFYNNLGTLFAKSMKYQEAQICYHKAISLTPDYAEVYRNLGLIHLRQNNMDESQAYFNRAIQLKPDYWQVQSVLGRVYLAQGKAELGWQQYEWRLKSPRWHALSYPRWQGERLAGKKILLYYEQGFGDTLQFVRYANWVAEMAAETTLWVQPELQRLLTNMSDKIKLHPGKQKPSDEYDFACPLLSLPYLFKTKVPQVIPYIYADDKTTAKWKSRLENGNNKHYRVGVVWGGNPGHHNDINRSIPFAVFSQLFALNTINWISLQVGPRAAQLTRAASSATNLAAELVDFAETAGLIANLDLVITVDSAVSHLAAAMGKPTWLLLPFAADWRWQMQQHGTPWYSTVRIFQQKSVGDWQGVVADVMLALQAQRDCTV